PEAKMPSDWWIIPEKPDDWDESIPRMISDPMKMNPPEDWDESVHGKYSPPMIPNPDCKDGKCGPWDPQPQKNPKYPEETWKPPKIKNPLYKGEWKPRMIENPDYKEIGDPLSLLQPIGAIGF